MVEREKRNTMGRGGRGQRGGRGRRDRDRNEPRDPFEEKTVFIRRVAKVVKGGRRFNFSSLLVVGDRKGQVGIGMGKGADVVLSIGKAGKQARKRLFTVPRVKTTIPHEIIGHFGASRVLLRPAAPGTGIIAGAAVRAVLELAGYKDILTKALGSRNPLNVVRATVAALQGLKNPVEVARRRNLPVKELMGFEITDPELMAAAGIAPAAAAVDAEPAGEGAGTNETV